MSKASVTKLSGVSIQVASFASALDLPTSELVAVVSLNLGQSNRIADLRQVLEADGLSTVVTNEDTLGVIGVQVNLNGLLGLFGLLGLDFLELSSQSDVTNVRVLGEVSKASVTKLSGVSIQVASFASALDLPTSELVAVVSLNLGQSDRIADLRQVLEADGLSTIITNESTLVIVSVQVDFDGLLDLRLLFLNLCGVEVNIAIGVLNISIGQLVASLQDLARAITSPSIVALGQSRGDDFRVSLSQNLGQIRSIIRIRRQSVKANSNFSCICKRCKRHAHDEHESGSQQSQQTSFEIRFLHVNFSYSLKFI